MAIVSSATPSAWVSAGIRKSFIFSWDSFAETVKHVSRFVYIGTSTRPGHENEAPACVSRFLDGLLAYVQDDMLITLEPGEKLYRGRMTEDTWKSRREVSRNPAKALGPAPAGRASAGRLNHEGISVFYGATTADCAVREISLHSPLNDPLVGAFEVKKSLTILDFTKRPSLSSMYATEERHRFFFARFFEDFVHRIAMPVILAGGPERQDYLPSAIVADYLRFAPDRRIDGLAWPSRIDPDG